jgi:flagellar export protein FliJ
MSGFRLATVERLRGQELHARAQDLHVATGTLEMTVVRRDVMVAKLNDSDGSGPAGTVTGADLQLAGAYRELLRAKIQIDGEQIVQLEGKLDEARIAWLTARVALRAVQSLHERHRKAVQAERARLDQRELDELAGTPRGDVARLRKAAMSR